MKTLFDDEIPKVPNGPKGKNPMVAIYGSGPSGAKCAQCVHLVRKVMGNTYLKCALRRNTGGPATDQKANWPACGKFEIPNK